MSLNILDNGRVDAYLNRLGMSEVDHNAAGLARLQAAHLMSVPFHNLLLLANDGKPKDLQPLQEVVDTAIAGIGGNCDRTTPPFTVLLQTIGFDAFLAGATVRKPGDHFVCVVQVDGRRFLCDVGNGHPYLRPWDLDGPIQEQAFQGWLFHFDPHAPEGPTLRRQLPDGGLKTVYVVDPTPRNYMDFAPMVNAHYTATDFGPFLTGLRAVCIRPEAVLTLRDSTYTRDTHIGRSVRQVRGPEGVRALLTERFSLSPRLVDDALEVVLRRRPDLFAEPEWFSLGLGWAGKSSAVKRPPREDVPDVLVSFATIGRTASVERLLHTLADEVKESRYPGRVGVLIVENHEPTDPPVTFERDELTVYRVPIERLRYALERATDAGVLPPMNNRLPVSIGAAREAQLAVLREHLHAPIGDLPHPSEHPVVVWMIDDDLAFQQVNPEGYVGRHTHLLFRVARFWSQLPQHAVVLGAYTGDPPIPGLDGLGGQLHDLAKNVEQMVALGHEAPWLPATSPIPTFDAYYDLTESTPPPIEAAWPYAPNRAGEPVRDVALSLLADLPRLLDGQQLTRTLVWDGKDQPARPSLRRGGNALFLDLDALFRWPTPVLTCNDGVTTRRADTLWAALAQRDQPGLVVEATLPLLHGREGQGKQAGHMSEIHAARHTAAQVRGVVLARAITANRNVGDSLLEREARVTAQRRRLCIRLGELRSQLCRLAEWGDPEIDASLARTQSVLNALVRLATAGIPQPGDAHELEAFLSQLPKAVHAWRRAW